jgi:hypothetical protein
MTGDVIQTALALIRQETEEKQQLETLEAKLLQTEAGEACSHVLAYDAEQGTLFLRFETEGTDVFEIMEGIERVQEKEPVQLQESSDGLRTAVYSGQRCLGTLPEKIRTAFTMLEQEGLLHVEQAVVHSLVPVSRRGRYAKRAIVWIELYAIIKPSGIQA